MKIPILHLTDGIHRFEDTINTESLNFKRQDIYRTPLQIAVELNKFSQNIQCRIEIKSTASYQCDRCLKAFEAPVDTQKKLLFHIGPDRLETNEDDVVHVDKETVEVDLNNDIVEQLLLILPIKTICRKDCKGLCSGCGVDLNKEECQCGEKPIDPRWEKLKSLIK